MNISENLQRILTDKQNIANAINAKGVSCQFSESLDTYADKISRISGGGGVEPVFSDSDPLTFVGIHDSNYVALINEGATNNKVFEYNKNGSGWTTYIENSKIEINKYEYVQFRSNSTLACTTNPSSQFRRFITGGLFKCYGTISSLINNSNLVPANAFVRLFQGTNILTAPVLPGTSLDNYVYMSMFENCSNLTKAPALPATKLTAYCYKYMFRNCSSLTTAPALPATTLTTSCYEYMFDSCSSLTTAPALPATTLAAYCYQYMFRNCSSLTTAPALPATTLTTSCYQYMFDGCSKLNYIKAMFTSTPGKNYTYNWVKGVSSKGTFVKNHAATWTTTGVNAIPTGWTVQTASS